MNTTLRRRVVVDQSELAAAIGTRLREARLTAGLTQQQLAAGRYTKAYISALERGHSKPSMAALTFLAERLDRPVTAFIEETAPAWPRLAADLALASGRWQEAADAYGRLLAAAGRGSNRAELLRGAAEALCRLGRGSDATAPAAEAAELFGAAGREADAAVSSYWLACAQLELGNTTESSAVLQGILDRVRAGLRVEPDFRVRLLMARSRNESLEGNHAGALVYLEEARGLVESLDDRRRATYFYDLAYGCREAGDQAGAVWAAQVSLGLFRAADAELESGALENDLAETYLDLGNLERSGKLAAAARRCFERLADERWLAHVAGTQAQIALAAGDGQRAADFARESLALAERTGNDKAALSAVLSLARSARTLQRPEEALRAYERAAQLARAGRSASRLRDVLGEWGELLADTGQTEQALALMREALKAR